MRFTESEWGCLFDFTCGRSEFEWRDRVAAGFVGRSVFIGAGAAELRDVLTVKLAACLE